MNPCSFHAVSERGSKAPDASVRDRVIAIITNLSNEPLQFRNKISFIIKVICVSLSRQQVALSTGAHSVYCTKPFCSSTS